MDGAINTTGAPGDPSHPLGFTLLSRGRRADIWEDPHPALHRFGFHDEILHETKENNFFPFSSALAEVGSKRPTGD